MPLALSTATSSTTPVSALNGYYDFDVYQPVNAKGSYDVDGIELVAIDPALPGAQTKAYNFPPSDEIPAGYYTDALTFEPNVGVHWYNLAALPGTDDFEKILFFGSWDGVLTFIEPRLAWDWLVNKPEFSEPLEQPVTWPTEGSWPTTWSVSFDEENRHFVVTLGGFE